MIDCTALRSFGRLTLAVSGGKDSMCMLDYFVGNADALPPFSVINFEHGLRGSDSEEDSRFVARYCREKGVECRVVKLDCRSFCEQGGYGVEQGARILRRREYERIVASGEADRVLTAHHADDNTESVLMHILRGSGLKGLCGIPRDDGVVFRPLLCVTRKEIDSYVASRAVPYREDASNGDNSYSRNFLRNGIIPELESRYPGVRRNLIMLAERAGRAYDFIYERSPHAQVKDGAAFLDSRDAENGGITAEFAVFDALDKIGGRVDVTSDHIADIIRLSKGGNGKKVCLPGGFRAVKSDDRIWFYKETAAYSGEEGFVEQGTVQTGVYTVTAGCSFVSGALRINPAAVPSDAVWRTRRQGDKFTPFGGGRRSLGDWFTDRKVPVHLRDELPVLACGSEVLAVGGYEISSALRVCEGDKTVYVTIRRNI